MNKSYHAMKKKHKLAANIYLYFSQINIANIEIFYLTKMAISANNNFVKTVTKKLY